MKWCLYCSYLRCYLSNEVAYFFVVREPNLLFSQGQLLEYQGIEIGSRDRIRTCTTNTLNVPPTAIWATRPFLVHPERFELSCLSAQPPQGCVYTISTTDAGRGSRTRTCDVSKWWRLYRPLSSLLDVIPRSLRDYQAIKEDALAVDCSALM